jgi:hypothetical protein
LPTDEIVDVFLPRAREVGDMQMLVPAPIAASVIEMINDRRDASLERLEEFERVIEPRPDWLATELGEAVRVALWAGEPSRASRLVGLMRSGTDRDRLALAGAEAAIAEATSGDPTGTARLYASAAEGWQRFGHVVEQAFALLGQGRCLVRAGEHASAVQPLQDARGILSRLGVTPLLAEVDALLG